MIVTKEQFVNNIEKPNLQKLYTFLYVLLVIMTNNVVHTLHEGWTPTALTPLVKLGICEDLLYIYKWWR